MSAQVSLEISDADNQYFHLLLDVHMFPYDQRSRSNLENKFRVSNNNYNVQIIIKFDVCVQDVSIDFNILCNYQIHSQKTVKLFRCNTLQAVVCFYSQVLVLKRHSDNKELIMLTDKPYLIKSLFYGHFYYCII